MGLRPRATRHVPVLIVGGGPIGLTGSNLLSQFDVEHLLVNRRPATSDHPRARFMDVRTLEILRQVGLADAVIDTGVPPEWVSHVRYSTTLAEPEIWALPTGSYHSVPRPYSPTVPVMTSQDLIEPIMAMAARRHDTADIRFGTELAALSQDPERVTAVIRDMHNGETETVTADYVIGADGRNSTVRELIGGELMEGFSQSGLIQDVLFHADLSRWVRDRIGALLFVFHPMGYGLFQPVDARTRWRAQCTTFTPAVEPDDITPELCTAWIRSAMGDTDGEIDLEVLSIAPWAPEAHLSDAFRAGRVFLAGDAAHILVPTGGLGMNLGYHGVHNLAWKLAFVLRGCADPAILDTYETERREQSDRTRVASVDNARLAGDLYRTHFSGGDVPAAAQRLLQYGNFEGLILGHEYSSPLCMRDADGPPVVDNEITEFVPVVRSGRRAPHVWLDPSASVSLLDRFGERWVLVVPSDAPAGDVAADSMPASAPGESAAQAVADSGYPIGIERVRAAALAADGLYATDETVLVRPDGFVAARFTAGAEVTETQLRDVTMAV